MKQAGLKNKRRAAILAFAILASSIRGNALAAHSANFADDNFYLYNALENKSSVTVLFAANYKNVIVEKKDNDNDEIAREVREIIEKQNYSTEKAGGLMDKIEGGSGLGKFLFGTNLGMLRFQLVQIKDLIYHLEQLSNAIPDAEGQVQIMEKIEASKEKQTKIENFISEQEQKFSLLGWFTKVL